MSTMSDRRFTLARAVAAALGGTCIAALVTQPALAQETDLDAPRLEEVVVTAQHREQPLEEVPITMNVVNDDLLNDVAADDLSDLNGFVPGLLVWSASPTQPAYQIRGIRTADFGIGTDPAIGVYVNGVYMARSGASLLAFNDIERIEVLKGPQGTLFGRNSAAGAISVVTRQPVDDLDAQLKLRVGEYGKQQAEGMVNLPLTGGFSLRASGLWNKSDGWVEDGSTGKHLWPEDNWATRLSLRSEITSETQALLTWDHDAIDQNARPAFGLVPLGPDDARAPYPPDPATFLDPRKAWVHNDVTGNEESRGLDALTLFVDHDFGWSTLRSTTAWRQFDTRNREDEDGTNRLALYFDTANVETNESWYQEFRLSGRTATLDWVAGLSYYDEDARQSTDTHASTDSVDTALLNLGLAGTPDGTLFGYTSSVLAAGGIPLTMLGLPWREVMRNEGHFRATALYGDVIWHANQRLNVTAGLRYTHDHKDFSWFNGPRQAPELDATVAALQAAGFFDTFPIPPSAYRRDLVFAFPPVDGQPIEGARVTSGDAWDDLSPRLVLDYRVTPEMMVFGSLARGYTAGGFNSVQPLSHFDSEDVWNVEAGVKGLFAMAGVIVNASVFRYQYRNKQAVTFVQDAGSVGRYVVDTSDQQAWGFDLDSRWQPLDAFTLTLAAQYIDATYDDYISPTGADLSGEPTGEPFLSAALGANYVWTFASLGRLDLSAQYAYRGETRCNGDSQLQGTCRVSPNFDVGQAMSRADARLAWSSPDDRWGAAVFITNLFDDQSVYAINNTTAAAFGTPFAMVSEPRMWGLEVRVGL
jgi:iron complex outermembrane receptor protein